MYNGQRKVRAAVCVALNRRPKLPSHRAVSSSPRTSAHPSLRTKDVHRSSGSPGADHDLGVGTCPRCRSQEVQRLFLPVIPFAQATRKGAVRIVNSFAAGRARTRRRGGRGDDPGDPGSGPLPSRRVYAARYCSSGALHDVRSHVPDPSGDCQRGASRSATAEEQQGCVWVV